ncbi:unnamed protein product [Menidia menidia]|uniref:(Atlantic silverside) hypothetical protein n=1 Tax=Menidia menidia TaxID=238744 RepID=A0A8S4ABX1_9TELE|nr:unnamed protein product [Menidia menidia]
METCFLNHVPGLCVPGRLLLLLLALPRPLRAGGPAVDGPVPATEGFYHSPATRELSLTGSAATATSRSGESLSPSQRSLLLTRAADTHAATAAVASFDTEQTESFTETSNRSPETTNLSTEPLTSTLTATLTDNAFTTTISRAGERTLLSVTSSSTNTSSAVTEESNSQQSSSTWAIPPGPSETEGYTQSAPSTRTIGRETTDQRSTGTFSGTGSPAGTSGTQSLTGRPNATQDQHTSVLQQTSDSTPPLRVSEPSTDQSEVSVSSTPSFTSPAGGPINMSEAEQVSGSSVGISTESSTETQSSSTQNQEGTAGVSSHTSEHGVDRGLTAVPSTARTSTSEISSRTDVPIETTWAFHTATPVTVTDRSQVTEEDTPIAATFATTTVPSSTPSPAPLSSSSVLSSTYRSSTSGSPTEAPLPYTPPSTRVSTPALQTSATGPTRHASPRQTQRPSTGTANPTDATTLQTEGSTGTRRTTTAHSQHITATHTHSSPTRSTEAQHTTKRQSDGGATVFVVTTSPTAVEPTRELPKNPCLSNPCRNGGMCVSYKGPEFTCRCQQAWTGPTCNQDVDECEDNPCPTGSRCVNTRGSFSCECPLGFDLEDGRTCTRAKTFLGTFSFNRHDLSVKSAAMHEIQREIVHLLNMSLSVLRGYSRSTVSQKEQGGVHILAVNMFSISTDVTTTEVNNSIQMFLSNCSFASTHCRMVLLHQLSYHTGSLCEAQNTQCDKERSTCSDLNGTAYCQCRQGYYKHNPEDLSCLECKDGFKLENGTCVPCMFGFGGFNCGNFYKLIAVVVSPVGGALLLILIIALIVTCCKKDKNDINKIIFKSGDMQMSPYADFPKNNRISMEWGRETIEMQENGSTKNLLQMTDIYYSPALRNSDLERNGLYPFTGLPGSRHSCIYPAQWNPSFISDDSRRRDYF